MLDILPFCNWHIMNANKNNKISIGILAHVDAGKTTLTEKLLVATNTISQPGNVDKGTSVSDSLKVEKERGISVKSSVLTFFDDDLQINLIDTPGHSDFVAEIPRALAVLDLAILVVSASRGIEAQTVHLWNLCQSVDLPVVVFINKLDQPGVDFDLILEEIKSQLSPNSFCLQSAQKIGTESVRLDNSPLLQRLKIDSTLMENLTEALANVDDDLMESYLNGDKISAENLIEYLIVHTLSRDIIPIIPGSVKFDQGVKQLLAFLHLIQTKMGNDINDKAALQVFKINYRNNQQQEVYVKMLSGSISVRDTIINQRNGKEEKINFINITTIPKIKQVNNIQTGDIGILEGLHSARIGDMYGFEQKSRGINKVESAFTVQIKPSVSENYPPLAEALTILNREEPNLNFNWLKDEEEFHLDVNGYIHMQVLTQILRDRFNLEIQFMDPTIIYRETPVKTGLGFVEYTMPKPCWAVATFRIEPGERGSGVKYRSTVSVDKIKSKYQHEVARTIPHALEQGIKGWEVTDIVITMIDGEDHEIHSRPSDFIIATPMGIMNGLQHCDTNLLEPVMNFSLTVPEEKSGRAMSDITRMRGRFSPPEFKNGLAIIKGQVPAATSSNYQMEVSSYTSGKGIFFTSFYRYEDCPPGEGAIRSYRGISPLDRSKYILKARKAITEGIKK